MLPLRDTIPSRRFPLVNTALIIANISVFVLETTYAAMGEIDAFVATYALIPAALLADPVAYWHTLFTSQFLHAGFWHLGGNMLYLFIFGDNVEDRLGHAGYLLAYLLWGTVAGLTQLVFNPGSFLPMMGASGAVAGVLGTYYVLYPTAGVLTLVPFFGLAVFPASVFLGFWFVFQLLQGSTVGLAQLARGVGGVAYFAHIGGFVSGVVSGLLVRRRARRRVRTYWSYHA